MMKTGENFNRNNAEPNTSAKDSNGWNQLAEQAAPEKVRSEGKLRQFGQKLLDLIRGKKERVENRENEENPAHPESRMSLFEKSLKGIDISDEEIRNEINSAEARIASLEGDLGKAAFVPRVSIHSLDSVEQAMGAAQSKLEFATSSLVTKSLQTGNLVSGAMEMLDRDEHDTLVLLRRNAPHILLSNFDHLVALHGGNEAGDDEEKLAAARQEAFDTLEAAYTGNDSLDINEDSLDDLVILGQRQGVKLSQDIIDSYLYHNIERSENSSGFFLNRLDYLNANGVAPEAIVEKMLENKRIGAILSRPSELKYAGIDLEALGQRIRTELPADEYIQSFYNRHQDLPYFGLELTQQQITDYNNDVKCEVPELKGSSVNLKDLPPEVKAERNQMFEDIWAGEDLERAKQVLDSFTASKWKKLNLDEKKTKMTDLLHHVADTYGLKTPPNIEITPASEFDATTLGDHHRSVVHKSYTNAQELRQALNNTDIDTPYWLVASKIRVNERYLNNGASIADTVAHEVFHAFQAQQAFLWAHGYFETKNSGEDFRHTPKLAQYYAYNLQSGSYQKTSNYVHYRRQLVEKDAFMVGGHYSKMVRQLEASALLDSAKNIIKPKLGDSGNGTN